MDWTAQLDDNLFDDAAVEHVTISSETPEGDIAQDAGTANSTLSQSSKVRKETRTLTIFDERFVSVCIERSRSRKTQYQFNLAFLDPTPTRLAGIAWRWLYASLALIAISLLAMGLSSLSATPLLQQPWLPANVLIVVTTIITVLVFIYRTRFTVAFHSLHGRAPLVEMAAWNPRRSAVENFVVELQQRVAAAQKLQWQDKPQFLCDELRAHYRLWEEGVLPDEVYEAGKVRILAEHG